MDLLDGQRHHHDPHEHGEGDDRQGPREARPWRAATRAPSVRSFSSGLEDREGDHARPPEEPGRAAGRGRSRRRRGSRDCSAGVASRRERSADEAELAQRVERVLRAGRVVLAARAEPERAHHQRGSREQGERRGRSRQRSRSAAAPRPPRSGARQNRCSRPPRPGRAAREDVVMVGRRRPPTSSNAARSRRFNRLRSTAPPTLRETARPSRGPSSPGLLAREGVEVR